MTISRNDLEQVRRRAGFACEYCSVTETDSGGPLTVDHFQPQARGGTDELTFTPQSDGTPARLRVEYKTELVRYSGVEPLNVYWREGDGVWHQAQRHWRARACTVIKPASSSEEQFTWSEQKSRFVPAGS